MSELRQEFICGSDGVEIAYLSFGEGRPLVMSHGGFTIADEWFDTARALSGGRRVVVIERRGRGRSGDAPEHSLDLEIEDLRRVIAAVGGDVDLFGHSYGGALSTGYTMADGFRGKVVLYEPTTAVAALVGGPNMHPVKALFAEGQDEASLELLYTSVLRIPPQFVAQNRGSPTWDHHLAHLGSFLREVDALDGFAPSIEDCSGVSAPMALLLGTTSDEWTRNNAAAFVQRIKGLTVLPVPGESHFAHLTTPQALAARIETALDLLD